MERSVWAQLEFKGVTLHCALLFLVLNSVWILLLVFIVGLTGDEPATQVLTQNSLSESLEEIRVKLGQKQYLEAYYLLRNAEKQFPGAQELRYLCLNTVKSPLIFMGLMCALISCSILVILAQ
jgi:ABC-type dipeptide/oligopeptide/nickel transport system permease component